MELVFKAAAAALAAALLGLLFRRHSPESGVLLGLGAVTVILLAALPFTGPLRELARTVSGMTGEGEIYLAPILKCVGIAIVTKFSAALCKDASQAAPAAAVEFAGTVCAVSVAMPLILSMLKMIGGLL